MAEREMRTVGLSVGTLGSAEGACMEATPDSFASWPLSGRREAKRGAHHKSAGWTKPMSDILLELPSPLPPSSHPLTPLPQRDPSLPHTPGLHTLEVPHSSKSPCFAEESLIP